MSDGIKFKWHWEDIGVAMINDLTVVENLLANMAMLSIKGSMFGIFLSRVNAADICGNVIENLGTPASTGDAQGIHLIGGNVRLSGNRIFAIAHQLSSTAIGIYTNGAGIVDIVDNQVQCASQPPQEPPRSFWVALVAAGTTMNIRGNILVSFGGKDQAQAGTDVGFAATIIASSCVFSNNQCSLLNADASGAYLVGSIKSEQTLVVIGNDIQGPGEGQEHGEGPPPPPTKSLELICHGSLGTVPKLTVIGNIVSKGVIYSTPLPPSAMIQLNVPPEVK